MPKKPACLGGQAIAQPPLPFARPLLPSFDEIESLLRDAMAAGMVTTGPNAERLGQAVARRLGVKHAIAVSSCTSGLMLAIQSLGIAPGSKVILPSFTFMATGLAAVWNQLVPVFADVDPETMNIDLDSVESLIDESTALLIALPQFGNPAPVESIEALANRRGIRVIYDSAHGMGSLRDGVPLGGNGSAEAFSLTPTKPVIGGEGGIVTTNDDAIAEHVRIGRNYGNPGDYNCLFAGMNARMSELHAIMALKSLDMLDRALATRRRVAPFYQSRLSEIDGIGFQRISPNDQSTFKDFTIIVDSERYGLSAGQLACALEKEGIGTRVYYSPVLHQMDVFQRYVDFNPGERLPNTMHLQQSVLSLPLYSDMSESEAEIVCQAIQRLHEHASEAAKALS